MDAPTNSRVTLWLKAARGSETQEDLAADITAKTGWRITRDRYSKYESGKLPIGPQTYDHFLAYWKSRGKAGPDLEPPVEREPEATITDLIRAQTAAINAQTDMLKAVLITLAGPQMPPETRAWVEQQMAATLSPLPTPNHPGSAARS